MISNMLAKKKAAQAEEERQAKELSAPVTLPTMPPATWPFDGTPPTEKYSDAV
jgi:hypothetical protein